MATARPLLLALMLGGCATTRWVEPEPSRVEPVDMAVDPPRGDASQISGRVTHQATKVGLANALVILQSSALEGSRESVTNDEGLYAFSDLPEGSYTIQVLAGQADVSKVTTLPQGSRFRANFSVDPDLERRGCCCVSWEPRLDQSLFYVNPAEGRLLGIPRTLIRL